MPQALRDASRSKIPVGVCVYTNTGLTFLLFFWCQIAIASQILEVRNQYGLDNKSEGEDKGDEERSLSAGFRRWCSPPQASELREDEDFAPLSPPTLPYTQSRLNK
ncbi:hypothetical protein PQG02_00955 [Nostoc sp. UHCC 0926]|uniref:hypothetical protein n=1 Tax=unclassified Nostoc TaxID=2593658 RepID=UPI002360BDC3|nr:hypothetical protein [Nostoc sp. UHCC 0926]WDD33013.1 hypothetical protein PQG02_00955 [Nostoc sp. UHCC 0926]